MRNLWSATILLLMACGDDTSAVSESDSKGGSSGGSSGSTGACMVGFAGCPCSADGLCLAGLACVDQQCVGSGDSATDTVPTGSDSASASEGSAASVTASTTQDGGTGSTSSATQSVDTDPSTSGTSEQSTAVSNSDTSEQSTVADTSTGTTVGVGDSDSSGGGSSTGGANVCGDGVADGAEECDGDELGGKDCTDVGFMFGALGCTPGCTHDTAKCTNSAACGDGIIVQNVLCYKPVQKPSAYHMWSITLGDMNEDGHLDLVGGSQYVGTRILFGNGDGTFQPLTKHLPALMMQAGHILDINKDGHLDLVGRIYVADKIQIALGDGKGGLSAAVNYDTLKNNVKIDLADVDGDGLFDMVLCGGSDTKSVAFRRGQPGGLFGPQVTYPVDPTYGGYTCGFVDFDLDGDLDIWSVVGGMGGTNFRVLNGDGNGKFTLDPTLIKFAGSQFAHVAHLDGDEYFDVVGFSDTANLNDVLNVRHGTQDYLEDMLYTFAMEGWVDSDSDGLVGNFDGNDILNVTIMVDNNLDVFRGDGTGLFHDGVSLATGAFLVAGTVGDLNEDGIDDLVTTHFSNQVNGLAQKVFLSDP